MTRGRRKDIPAKGTHWIDYTPIEPGWEHWEQQFGSEFDEQFRRELCRLKSYFEEHKRTYDSNHRLEPKELERALSKAQKSGQLEYEHLAEFIYASFSEQIASNPSASPLDLIGYALDALKEDPEGFLMEHERPETASSHAFYGAFEKAGFNLAGLSNSTFGGQPGDQHVPLPPIIEFINRVVYGRETQLLGDARAIQQSIKRYKNQRRGQQP